MVRDITVFEAAALADCRRDGVGGYRSGTIAEIIARHGVDLDRICTLWDAEKKRMAPPPSNVVFIKGSR